MSKQIEHVQFVLTLFDIVVKNDNNIEATFDFVERTKFYDKLVEHCCHFWQESRIQLRQS